MRSPTCKGCPLESVVRPSPRAAIRPVPSWPWWIGTARPRLTGSSSPRHRCRSEPHTLASVIWTRAAPGSGSGTGYSRISNGWPFPTKTAARPVSAMRVVLYRAMTTLRIGSIELAVVSDGKLRMDPGLMFGPGQPDAFREHVELEEGRVPFAVNCALVRVGSRLILLDTGAGRDDPAMLERYGHG